MESGGRTMRKDTNWNRLLAIDFIKSYVEQSGMDGVVFGTSGGIDSTVCLALCHEALRKSQVTGLWLPNGEMDTKYIDIVSEHFRKKIGIYSIKTYNIEDIVREFVALSAAKELRLGNILARTRMTILYDFAKEYNLLVVNTSNRSEIMTGYFTKWGDGAGDIAPIAHLFKYEVIEIAKELCIPNEIIQRVPSADFWEGQTDEGELGISYEDLDAILEGLEKIHTTGSPLEVYRTQRQLESKYSVDMIDHVLGMMQSTAHKRQVIPNPGNWYGWER